MGWGAAVGGILESLGTKAVKGAAGGLSRSVGAGEAIRLGMRGSGFHAGAGAAEFGKSLFRTAKGIPSVPKALPWSAGWYGAATGLESMADTKWGEENPTAAAAMRIGSFGMKVTAGRIMARGVMAAGFRGAGAFTHKNADWHFGKWVSGTSGGTSAKYGLGGGGGFSASSGVRPVYSGTNAWSTMDRATRSMFSSGSLGGKAIGLGARGLAATPGVAARQTVRTVVGVPFAAGHMVGTGFDAVRAPFRWAANLRRAPSDKLPVFGSRRMLGILDQGLTPRWAKPGGRIHAGFAAMQRVGMKTGVLDPTGAAPIASGFMGGGALMGIIKRSQGRGNESTLPKYGSVSPGIRGATPNFAPAMTLALHHNHSRVF